MIKASQFVAESIKLSVFTKIDRAALLRLLRRLPSGVESQLDMTQTTLLPIIERDRPAQIPLAVFQGAHDKLTITVTVERIDVDRADLDPTNVSATFTEYSNLIEELLSAANTETSRFGAIIKRRMTSAITAKDVASHFCKDHWMASGLNRPEQFELHAHKTYAQKASGMKVNSWIRSRVGSTGGSATFTVEQDMNTVSEESHPKSSMPSFYGSILPEFDECLRVYYGTKS